MLPRRRSLLIATTALTADVLTPTLLHARPMTPTLDPVPPVPTTPTPGKPGDFNFLAGEWRIHHWQRQLGKIAWDTFDGEATCWTILGGVGSIEELRIPARNFSGMGLRLLDLEKKVWSDFWVNAKSGVLAPPGLTGSFEGGTGIFISDDLHDGKPIKAGGLWDRITPTSCRWRQVISRDGGATWEHTWVMHWQRA